MKTTKSQPVLTQTHEHSHTRTTRIFFAPLETKTHQSCIALSPHHQKEGEGTSGFKNGLAKNKREKTTVLAMPSCQINSAHDRSSGLCTLRQHALCQWSDLKKKNDLASLGIIKQKLACPQLKKQVPRTTSNHHGRVVVRRLWHKAKFMIGDAEIILHFRNPLRS